MHLWRQDRSREIKGQKGQFFLRNYANVPMDALQILPNGDKVLVLDYDVPQNNFIELKIRSDDNAVFNGKSSAAITEIYIDTTNYDCTIIHIKVHNNGLIACRFRVRIASKLIYLIQR